MKLVPMKFNGYAWSHNPEQISFECDKKVNELKAAGWGSYIQNTGRKNIVIKGSGKLCGEDCLEQFAKLYDVFKKGDCGVLSVPHLPAVYAVFESLKLTGEPQPDMLSYQFVFREVMEEKPIDIPSVHIMKYGETLWDVSYIFDIPIDLLIKLNPEFKTPDESIEGFTVILC